MHQTNSPAPSFVVPPWATQKVLVIRALSGPYPLDIPCRLLLNLMPKVPVLGAANEIGSKIGSDHYRCVAMNAGSLDRISPMRQQNTLCTTIAFGLMPIVERRYCLTTRQAACRQAVKSRQLHLLVPQKLFLLNVVVRVDTRTGAKLQVRVSG